MISGHPSAHSNFITVFKPRCWVIEICLEICLEICNYSKPHENVETKSVDTKKFFYSEK